MFPQRRTQNKQRHYRSNSNPSSDALSFSALKDELISKQLASAEMDSIKMTLLGLTMLFMLFLAVIAFTASEITNSSVLDFKTADPEGYQQWLSSEEELTMNPKTTRQRVDDVLNRSNNQMVDESVMSVLEEHCLNELHFKLYDDEMDFLLIQIERVIHHLIRGEPVTMDRDIDGQFMVTSDGQIVDSSDPLIRGEGRRENEHYGVCSMVNELMNRMRSKGLIQFVSTTGMDRVRHDAMTMVFTTQQSQSLQSLWSQQFQALFSLHDEERDIATLINSSSNGSKYDVESVHVMVHHLLHSYCGSVLNHLKGPFQRTTFIEAVTTNVMQGTNVEMKGDEVPIVDDDGHIFIGSRYDYDRHYDDYGYDYYGSYRYDGGYGSYSDSKEYASCPFLSKLMSHHFGGIEEQIQSALRVFDNFVVFEERMSILFQLHCSDSVVEMERKMNYNTIFKDKMRTFINDIMSTETISKHQGFAVNVQNAEIIKIEDDKKESGDLTNLNENEKEDDDDHIRDCPLINRIVKMFGVGHSNDFIDTKSIHSDEIKIDELSDSEGAQLILDMASRRDLNLRKVIWLNLKQLHSAETLYPGDPSSIEMSVFELAVLIEHFVLDLFHQEMLDNDDGTKEKEWKDRVFMVNTDFLSMRVISTKNVDAMDSDHWIQIPFMNLVLDSYHRQRVKQRDALKQNLEEQPIGEQSDLKVISKGDCGMVDLVKMIGINLSSITFDDDQDNDQEEDMEDGLKAFCDEVMGHFVSFGGGQLPQNVLSKMMKENKTMDHIVVNANGQVIGINGTSSIIKTWQCPAVETQSEKKGVSK